MDMNVLEVSKNINVFEVKSEKKNQTLQLEFQKSELRPSVLSKAEMNVLELQKNVNQLEVRDSENSKIMSKTLTVGKMQSTNLNLTVSKI